jgi:hypothetical protein
MRLKREMIFADLFLLLSILSLSSGSETSALQRISGEKSAKLIVLAPDTTTKKKVISIGDESFP